MKCLGQLLEKTGNFQLKTVCVCCTLLYFVCKNYSDAASSLGVLGSCSESHELLYWWWNGNFYVIENFSVVLRLDK